MVAQAGPPTYPAPMQRNLWRRTPSVGCIVSAMDLHAPLCALHCAAGAECYATQKEGTRLSSRGGYGFDPFLIRSGMRQPPLNLSPTGRPEPTRPCLPGEWDSSSSARPPVRPPTGRTTDTCESTPFFVRSQAPYGSCTKQSMVSTVEDTSPVADPQCSFVLLPMFRLTFLFKAKGILLLSPLQGVTAWRW